MELCNKYRPILLSELEYEYPIITEYLKSNKSFIVNGENSCGKTTIVKLYLNKENYDYKLIDDYNLNKEIIIEKIKYNTNTLLSFFTKKNNIIVIDNFDLFDNSIKEFIINNLNNYKFLIISNKYINNKINLVKIKNYSCDYLLNLYLNIFFLEKNYNSLFLPHINNISQMYSTLEINIKYDNLNIKYDNLNSTINSKTINYNTNNYDKFNYNYNDLVSEINFNNKLCMLYRIGSYNIFHNNIIYNHKCIDDLADAYNYLSESLNYLVNYNNFNILDYYPILSIIGTTYKINNFTVIKENFQIRKKKIIKYY